MLKNLISYRVLQIGRQFLPAAPFMKLTLRVLFLSGGLDPVVQCIDHRLPAVVIPDNEKTFRFIRIGIKVLAASAFLVNRPCK